MTEEVLNQELDESLFDSEETTEETETDITPDKEEVTEEAPFMTIRYNKEDKNLTKDEAIALSQKGMNYDKVLENFNRLNGRLESFARRNGMDVDTFLDNLGETQNKFELNREINSLREQYPDASEELLTELAQTRIKDRSADNEQRFSKAQEEEADAERIEIERQINALSEIFPEVDPRNLPNEVIEDMTNGRTLLEAYLVYDRKVNLEKHKVQLQNESNQKKSLGNTDNSSIVAYDDFMSGFDS